MKDAYLQEYGIAYRATEILPSRRTLVFIHGLSGSCSAWWEFEEKLQNDYNVVTYDLRGQGFSKKYARYRDYEIKQLADDLFKLLKHLHISSCSIVAHSYGTVIALELLQTGFVPASFVFLSINYRIGSLLRTRISLPFFMLGASLLRLFPFTPHAGTRINYRGLGKSPDWSFKRIYPEIKDMTLRIYLYCLIHVYTYAPQNWSSIPVPTLLLHGRDDSFVPVRNAVRAQKEIKSSRLKILEGANHMLVMNDAPRVVEEIKTFIK